MDTISVVFGLKLCHEWKGGWVGYGIDFFGSMISHTTFCSNKDVLVFNTTLVLTTWLVIFGPISY
jgi:hypothetical protein